MCTTHAQITLFESFSHIPVAGSNIFLAHQFSCRAVHVWNRTRDLWTQSAFLETHSHTPKLVSNAFLPYRSYLESNSAPSNTVELPESSHTSVCWKTDTHLIEEVSLFACLILNTFLLCICVCMYVYVCDMCMCAHTRTHICTYLYTHNTFISIQRVCHITHKSQRHMPTST